MLATILSSPGRMLANLLFLSILYGAGTTAQASGELHIGYQKYGTLILLKVKGSLDRRLESTGTKVKWSEFQFGPPMLEALNAGVIDIAATGETGPVFAQAAKNSQLVYVAYEPPSPASEGLLVPGESPIRQWQDLKGRKVAVGKGSNAHYFLVAALAKAGLRWTDIQPVYLAPADARPAFERGAVDAWALWDFHLAAAQEIPGSRLLADANDITSNHEIYSARREFAASQPELLKIVLEEVDAIDRWTRDHPGEAAAILSAQVGIAPAILEKALKRRNYGVRPIGPELIAGQQAIADSLVKLRLIPKPVKVADAIWKPQ